MDNQFNKSDLSIYENNLNLLKSIGPQILYILSIIDENECPDFEILKTHTNLLNLKVSGEKGRYLVHSNFDPYVEASKIDTCSKDDGVDTIIILGLGLGYHVEYFINKYPEKNKIIIEPNAQLLNLAMKLKDFDKILNAENTKLILTADPKEASNELIYFYDSKQINSVEFISLTSSLMQNKKYWDELREDYVIRYREEIMNMITTQLFKFTWTENIIKNIKHITNSSNIKDYTGKFDKVPGIVVASGPSLNRNAYLLKELKNKALIVAAGTAINPLMFQGIEPHIMLGVDGGKIMADVVRKLESNNMFLAYLFNLHYDCLETYKGPKLFLRTNSELKAKYIDKEFNLEMPELMPGPSCANVAAEFLFYLGCDPIIFVGQDLCYEKDNTHAGGSIVNYSTDKLAKGKVITALDMDGNTVKTSHGLLAMKGWFDRYFKLKSGQRTFINATVSGLPLEGSIRMNLDEVIEEYCSNEINIEEMLCEIHTDSILKRGDFENKVTLFLENLYKETKSSIRMSNKRLKIASDILNDVNNGKISVINDKREKMFKITNELEESDFFKYFLYIDNCDVNLAIKNTAETEALKEKDPIKKLKILYFALLKQYTEIHARAVFIRDLLKEQIKVQRKVQ